MELHSGGEKRPRGIRGASLARITAAMSVLLGLAAISTGSLVARSSGAGLFVVLAPAAVTLLAAALCGAIIARHFRRGSAEIADSLARFGAGDMSARVDPPGVQELDAIAAGFNTMATKVAQATRRLAHEAFHDPLTGLPNRSYFMSRFRTALAETPVHGGRVAVLCLDLDRFKIINDTLGHGVGDELLSVLSIRLASSAGPGCMVARLGGDEFTVLLEQTGEGETIAIATRIVESLRQSFHVAGHELSVTVSVGVAISGRRGGTSANDLLRQADIALYRAKSEGASRFVLFRPEMDALSASHLELESGLRRATERGELVLHYQPEIDLATGALVGMEALVRWQHPQRGLVPPGDFIKLAEETGEIVRIGAWVLREACQRAALLSEVYPEVPLVVGVNVSARELRQPGIVQRVADVLAETNLPAEQLELEITESAVIDDLGRAIEILTRLRKLGVRLAIDDFGTGYSSLSYLHQLPLTTLKMDRTFVRDVARMRSKGAIARAIVDVAAALGMEVTAEGIETRDQLDFLRLLKCHRGQGYLFSRPVDAEAFARLVERRVIRTAPRAA